MREFDLNATGNRANDELAQKLFQGGEQTVSLNTEEARRYLDDPRFRLMDPQTGRRLTRQQLEARIKAADTEEKIHQVQVVSQGELKPATRGRNRPSHSLIPAQLRSLPQTSPYEQFAWVCLRKTSQPTSIFGWVDFARAWLVWTAR